MLFQCYTIYILTKQGIKMITATNIRSLIAELESKVELARPYFDVPISEPNPLVEEIVAKYVGQPEDTVE